MAPVRYLPFHSLPTTSSRPARSYRRDILTIAPNHPNNSFHITLRGKANTSIPAERAILNIKVSSQDPSKQTASKNVLSTARQVESLLIHLAPQQSTPEATSLAAVDYWSRTSLTETSHEPYEQGKYLPRVHTAQIDFRVQFQKFKAIGSAISDLSALAHVTTEPISWILLEETQEAQRSDLRARAARNARQKALEYAVALGYVDVVPFSLEESAAHTRSSNMKGPRGPVVEGTQTAKRNLAAVEVEGWEEVEERGGGVFEYQPEEITVSVSVDVVFYAK